MAPHPPHYSCSITPLSLLFCIFFFLLWGMLWPHTVGICGPQRMILTVSQEKGWRDRTKICLFFIIKPLRFKSRAKMKNNYCNMIIIMINCKIFKHFQFVFYSLSWSCQNHTSTYIHHKLNRKYIQKMLLETSQEEFPAPIKYYIFVNSILFSFKTHHINKTHY